MSNKQQEKKANEILTSLYTMYRLRGKAFWQNENGSIMIMYIGKIEEPYEDFNNTYLEFSVLINRDYSRTMPFTIDYKPSEKYKLDLWEFVSALDRMIFSYYHSQEHITRKELWEE